MKKICLSIFSMFLISIAAFAQDPQPEKAKTPTTAPASEAPALDAKAQVKKETKAAKEKPVKSDEEVQKCINAKIEKSEKLKKQSVVIAVANGEALFTGTAENSGSKGALTRIAQSCGAKTVKNDVSAPSIAVPKKVEEKKPKTDN